MNSTLFGDRVISIRFRRWLRGPTGLPLRDPNNLRGGDLIVRGLVLYGFAICCFATYRYLTFPIAN